MSAEIPQNLSQEEALRVLLVAVFKAQSKGAYTFDDAIVLSKASRALRKDENGEPIKSSIPKEFGQEEGLRILIGAIKKGQSKGVYDIDTASALSKAVRTFVIKAEEAASQESSKLETIVESNEEDDDGTIVV
jgi:hypothetical protein